MIAYADGTAESASYLFIIDDWKTKIRVSLKSKSAGEIAKLFQKGQVKDNASEPRSRKGATYLQMAGDILSGVDRISWLWSNNLRLFYFAAREMGAIISGGQ